MPADHANLALYFLSVLGVVALPGLDMGVVPASSSSHPVAGIEGKMTLRRPALRGSLLATHSLE